MKKKGRKREEKGRKFRGFHLKVCGSVCMVSFGHFKGCMAWTRHVLYSGFCWVDDEIARLILYNEPLMHMMLI